MENIIKTQNLSFKYNNNSLVIHDLDLAIKRGSYTVILGANGSGKSTLAKLLVGLLMPKRGQIFFNNMKLSEENLVTLRKSIGIVFQNPDNQFVGATVEDDIAFGLENLQVPHEKMQEIIEKYASFTDMLPYLKKEPCNLSGGQKQRVAIASVLAMNPSLLILDEATSMLDPKGKNEIKEVIRQMRKEKKDITIISITHDLIEAEEADEVIILHQGKIHLAGTPETVFQDEEALKAISLELPFHYKVKSMLKKAGINLENCDEEGMVDALCQLILKK